ncbi:unnamed protein product [Acanthoscelides obtectus]|uniref:Uncharacterized protein n=1 Tax=Acanthoscelides obtectus TaxID=200917 RepID=A0A9P0JK03_ACAOB|nr:unnamed protein product [Acanthoscelides obtectus]CAK1658109.1 hypothetical protein AOBTE_LOCUS20694 [Acanthoscelides obtectus]
MHSASNEISFENTNNLSMGGFRLRGVTLDFVPTILLRVYCLDYQRKLDDYCLETRRR